MRTPPSLAAFDLRQRHAIDVDDEVRRLDIELHQVDQRCSPRHELSTGLRGLAEMAASMLLAS